MEVRVKKLIWSNPGRRYVYKSVYFTEWRAPSILGTRVIRLVEHCDQPRAGYPTLRPFESYYSFGEEKFSTFEEAASAAQSWLDEMVMSAIEIVI